MKYADLLLDPRWQRKRLEVMQSAGWKCERCSAAHLTLHVHHTQYVPGRMPWEYERPELECLCETCHGTEHGKLSTASVSLTVARKPVKRRTVISPPLGLQAERALVRAMLTDPSCIDSVTEAIATIDEEALAADVTCRPTLRDACLKEIHRALVNAGRPFDVARIAQVLSPEAVETLEDLMGEQASVVNLSATIDDSITRLKIRWREELANALRKAMAFTDRAFLGGINRESLKLKQEIQSLGRRA